MHLSYAVRVGFDRFSRWCRVRQDRKAGGQGGPAERRCRARRRERPLHQHRLHGIAPGIANRLIWYQESVVVIG